VTGEEAQAPLLDWRNPDVPAVEPQPLDALPRNNFMILERTSCFVRPQQKGAGRCLPGTMTFAAPVSALVIGILSIIAPPAAALVVGNPYHSMDSSVAGQREFLCVPLWSTR